MPGKWNGFRLAYDGTDSAEEAKFTFWTEGGTTVTLSRSIAYSAGDVVQLIGDGAADGVVVTISQVQAANEYNPDAAAPVVFKIGSANSDNLWPLPSKLKN